MKTLSSLLIITVLSFYVIPEIKWLIDRYFLESSNIYQQIIRFNVTLFIGIVISVSNILVQGYLLKFTENQD